jgi:hypothetical protein
MATARRVVIRNFFRTLYRDRNGDRTRSIMVAGTGRSGTTWLGEIIASQLRSRIMFEPFHCRYVAEYAQFRYFQYLRPGQDCPAMAEFCQAVFSGRIRNAWIDQQSRRLRPESRVIKDVRANLLLGWIAQRFPEVPRLFIVRHPCAVVHSRLQLNWDTDADLEPMLAQPDLVEDHLADRLDLIRATQTDAGKHALVWCISNLVPLRQASSFRLPIVFYEHLRDHPRREIPRIFAAIGQPFQESVFDALGTPSSTSRDTRRSGSGAVRDTAWQRDLSTAQIAEILAIVDSFGLGHLYGDSIEPLA